MKLADVVGQMKGILTDPSKSLEARFEQSLTLAADFTRLGIGRSGEKSTAAVLMVEKEEGADPHLVFAYPPHLATGNFLPADDDSIAGRVVGAKISLIVNDLPGQTHQKIFQLIPDKEGEVRSIQKMIASPLLDGQGNVFGVFEVNRTGKDPQDAGPDFTVQDVSNLEACCRAFAPYIHRIWAAVSAR